MSRDVTVRRSIFGTTWALWYGYRPGIQVNRAGGQSSMRSKARASWNGHLGDALEDVQREAREQVLKDAADYRLPQPATTRARALRAMMLILDAGKQEDFVSKKWYRERWDKAAYTFRNAAPDAILRAAAGFVAGRKTPRARELAVEVLRVSGAGAPAAAKPAAKPQAPRTVRYPVEPEPAPLPPESLVTRATSGLPSWAPWAGAAGLVLIAALLLRPSASAAQKVTP